MARGNRDIDDTRDRILEAARGAFIALGYDATSIREVARRAGISHGTIYLHFRDKDDLLFQVAEDEFGSLLTRLRAMPRTQDPIQRLSEALRELGRYGLEYPHQYAVMMGHRPASFSVPADPRFGPLAAQVSSFLGDLVREAQKRSLLTASVTVLDELSLIAGVHGIVTMFALRLIDRETAERAVDHTTTLLLSALTGGSCQVIQTPVTGQAGAARHTL